MNNHRCYYCHEIIPEGRDVCWQCEHGAYENLKDISKKRGKIAIMRVVTISVIAAIIVAICLVEKFL